MLCRDPTPGQCEGLRGCGCEEEEERGGSWQQGGGEHWQGRPRWNRDCRMEAEAQSNRKRGRCMEALVRTAVRLTGGTALYEVQHLLITAILCMGHHGSNAEHTYVHTSPPPVHTNRDA